MAASDEASDRDEARKDAMDETITEVFSSLNELSELRSRYDSLVSEVSTRIIAIHKLAPAKRF